jgi:hypothetical protein
VVQGLREAEDGGADLDEAIDLAPKHSGYVLDHFHVKADGQRLEGAVTNIEPPKRIGTGLEGPDRAHFTYTIRYLLPKPPAVLAFSQNMCVEFPSAPGVPWDLSYATRYGPPENPTMKLSVLTRDAELSYYTGFAGAPVPDASAGGPPVEVAGSMVVVPRPLSWAALWLLFVAAVVLGGGLDSLWYKAGAVLWLGGFLAAGALLSRGLPLWAVALPGGVITIMAAVDNIYSCADPHPGRRRILFVAGCLCFGVGLSLQPPPGEMGLRGWGGVLILPALAVAAGLFGLGRLLRKRGAGAERLFTQLLSLAVCGSAVWLMLRLLRLVP